MPAERVTQKRERGTFRHPTLPGRRAPSRLDAELLAGDYAITTAIAGIHFEHVCDRAGDRTRIVVQRRHLLENAGDRSVGGDKQHVERDAGVVHTERLLLLSALPG